MPAPQVSGWYRYIRSAQRFVLVGTVQVGGCGFLADRRGKERGSAPLLQTPKINWQEFNLLFTDSINAPMAGDDPAQRKKLVADIVRSGTGCHWPAHNRRSCLSWGSQ